MLKAIETKYRGYRFRSRLEARWAVFFDTLGVDWEYEAEGYKVPIDLSTHIVKQLVDQFQQHHNIYVENDMVFMRRLGGEVKQLLEHFQTSKDVAREISMPFCAATTENGHTVPIHYKNIVYRFWLDSLRSNLPQIHYLPDFWLPKEDCWIEIKGLPPTPQEITKAISLASAAKKFVCVVAGSHGKELTGLYGGQSLSFGISAYINHLRPTPPEWWAWFFDQRYDEVDIRRAYAAARSARFEYGEHL